MKPLVVALIGVLSGLAAAEPYAEDRKSVV